MEAPTPVSAYLHSATMVKAGIYLVARFTPIFGESSVWFWLVAGVGLITLFWGSFFAVKQTDLKGDSCFFNCQSARFDYVITWGRSSRPSL